MKKYEVTAAEAGVEIFTFLKQTKGHSSRGLKKSDIYINNKKIKGNRKVHEGDIVRVKEEEKEIRIRPVEMEIDVAYEDRDLLIVNKPPFLITHPTLKKEAVSLANGIVWYYSKKGMVIVPRFYNRLDMNTSGLIVIAKNGHAQAFLQNHGEVKKMYYAVLKGIIKEDEIIIDKKIRISADGIKREIGDDGQEAKTKLKVIGRNAENDTTLAELELFTGRTHQIRVHTSSLGHPVLGDSLYGGESKLADRQLLHSYKIVFTHPATAERVEVKCGIPEDMKILFSGSGGTGQP